jgi:hypothetical protein
MHVKNKAVQLTCHGGTWRERTYSSFWFLTSNSALNGGQSSDHSLPMLYSWELYSKYPLSKRLGWPHSQSGYTGCQESNASNSLHRQALYWISYPYCSYACRTLRVWRTVDILSPSQRFLLSFKYFVILLSRHSHNTSYWILTSTSLQDWKCMELCLHSRMYGMLWCLIVDSFHLYHYFILCCRICKRNGSSPLHSHGHGRASISKSSKNQFEMLDLTSLHHHSRASISKSVKIHFRCWTWYPLHQHSRASISKPVKIHLRCWTWCPLHHHGRASKSIWDAGLDIIPSSRQSYYLQSSKNPF